MKIRAPTRKYIWWSLSFVLIFALLSISEHELFQINSRIEVLERYQSIQRTTLDKDYVSKIFNKEEFEMSYGPSRIQTPCINEQIPKIKSTGLQIKEAFLLCEQELIKALPIDRFHLNHDDLFAIYTTIVANKLAPYGNSSASTLKEILVSKYLNCAQQSTFVAEQIKLYGSSGVTIERVGLDGGSIGNHAIVSYQREGVQILLDGTTATIVFAGLEDVLAGQLVSTYSIYDFYTDTDESVEIFRRKVRGALRLGAVRPEHVIYRIKSSVQVQTE